MTIALTMKVAVLLVYVCLCGVLALHNEAAHTPVTASVMGHVSAARPG